MLQSLFRFTEKEEKENNFAVIIYPFHAGINVNKVYFIKNYTWTNDKNIKLWQNLHADYCTIYNIQQF